jgi:hypothetical protein
VAHLESPRDSLVGSPLCSRQDNRVVILRGFQLVSLPLNPAENPLFALQDGQVVIPRLTRLVSPLVSPLANPPRCPQRGRAESPLPVLSLIPHPSPLTSRVVLPPANPQCFQAVNRADSRRADLLPAPLCRQSPRFPRSPATRMRPLTRQLRGPRRPPPDSPPPRPPPLPPRRPPLPAASPPPVPAATLPDSPLESRAANPH